MSIRYVFHIRNIIQLSRFKEYIWFVLVLTCAGSISAHGKFDWRFLIALFANGLSVAFAFMVNDTEDAPDDKLDSKKRIRNPISAGRMSWRTAWIVSLSVGILALVAFAFLGRDAFVVGSLSVLISFLYSWKRVRLKSIPILDLISHGLMLAGLPFAVGYAIYSQAVGPNFYWPFITLTAFSMYGELFNELRDFECDRKAGVVHTASVLGASLVNMLMMVFGLIGFGSALVCLFILWIVPLWGLILLIVLMCIFMIYPVICFRRNRSWMATQTNIQTSVQIAAALALCLCFIMPWVYSLIIIVSDVNSYAFLWQRVTQIF